METELQEPYFMDGDGEPPAFTVFMDAYPKKDNRHAALREWKKISPDLRLEAQIMRSLRILRTTDKWLNGYVPSALSFLRDRRWRDADGLPDPKDRPVRTIDTLAPPSDFKPSTPASAKAALREGFLSRWRLDHPGQEPPTDLLKNPMAFMEKRADRKIERMERPTPNSYLCSGCGTWITPPEKTGDPACPVFYDWRGGGGHYHVPQCLPKQFEWDADAGVVRKRKQ